MNQPVIIKKEAESNAKVAILLTSNDYVRHFDGHGPGWKLAALIVQRLPAILAALGTLAAGSKYAGWW
ncbi:MAG: hypothetical protein V4532_03110 [Pseudomonadota bacterium]